jgi:hypothetical protein
LFSEHFGYPVQPREIGLHCEADTDVGLAYQSSLGATVALVADLGRNDVHRRDFLRTAPFVAAAAVAPSRDWLLATLDAAQRRPGGKISHKQVVAILEVFAVYQEADVMRGGGHARRALAQYVTAMSCHWSARSPRTPRPVQVSSPLPASRHTYWAGWPLTTADKLSRSAT